MVAFSVPRSLVIAFAVLLACFGLFSLDHETRSIGDLFTPGNLAALLIYFTPTFLICLGLYRLLRKFHSRQGSVAIALLSGIPTGFILLILVLQSLR